MTQPLPLRASLEWLRKLSKERLAALRTRDPGVKLSDAQREVAREYGFASWRKLKAHVEQVRESLDRLAPLDRARAVAAPTGPDDPELAQLLAAVDAGDLATLTQLLGRRPELALAHGPDGQTALHVAAERNNGRLAVFLLACGADPHATYGQSGHTALSWAVTRNASDFARTLVRLGVRPDLFCAAGIGTIEHVRAWFDASGTLLPGAASTGSTRLAPDGSRLPCPPPSAVEQVSDALYIACRNAHADVVRFLLTKTPDLSFRAYMGGTPLHWAHFAGSQPVIDLLVQAGADPAVRDHTLHCTPRAFGICVPANWGFASRIRERLTADPALANVTGEPTTPLHEAARSGDPETIQLLLDAGADPARRNGGGKRPLDVAIERGHAEVVGLLQSRAARSH
jgi:ankyrin repeat protein